MQFKKFLIVIVCFTGFFAACDTSTNRNDGTGEMPEDQTMGTGDEPYMPEDTADVDTLRLDSIE